MGTRQIIIAPSILAARFGTLAEEIRCAEMAGADWLHIDIMDGNFVPPITFGANVVELAKHCCALPLDVHLMVQEPEKHFEAFKAAGATRLTVHQETCAHLHRTLLHIKSLRIKAGVCVNPATPIQTIFNVLDVCDLVLVMTVNPGWGGQAFISSCLEKIKILRQEIDRRKLPTWIEVDGGINAKTAKQCIAAGANVLVAGSHVFGNKDRKAAITSLRPK